MKKPPLVSIVITYFKKKKYIKKTLNSIFNQSYKNFELIFVYDDSNISDFQFIKKLLFKFKRKKIILNKKNIGVSKSRNKALNNCKGKYIALIDSDDLWKKNKLNKQILFMEKNLTYFSFTSYNVIDTKNNVLKKKLVFSDPTYKNLLKKNIIGLSTVVFNRKILKHIKFPNLKTQEDFEVWLRLLSKGYKLSHIPLVLSSWRLTNDSLSSNILQKIKDAFRLYYFFQKKNLIFSIYSVIVLGYNKLFK